MKRITKQQLKRIIKEEYEQVLKEVDHEAHGQATKLGKQIASMAAAQGKGKVKDETVFNPADPMYTKAGWAALNYSKVYPLEKVLAHIAGKVAAAATKGGRSAANDIIVDLATGAEKTAQTAAKKKGAAQGGDKGAAQGGDLESVKQAVLQGKKNAHKDQGVSMRKAFKQYIKLGGHPKDVGIKGEREDYA